MWWCRSSSPLRTSELHRMLSLCLWSWDFSVLPLTFSLCMSHFWVYPEKIMRLNWIFCHVDLHPAVPREERWAARRWKWDRRLTLTGPLTLGAGAHVQAVPLQLCHFLQQTAAQQEMGSGLFSARQVSVETQTTSTSISNHGIVSASGRFRPSEKLL